MNEGRTLGDRLLTLTWAFDAALPITSQPPVSTSAPPSSHHSQMSPHSYASVTPHSTTALLSHDETLVSAFSIIYDIGLINVTTHFVPYICLLPMIANVAVMRFFFSSYIT